MKIILLFGEMGAGKTHHALKIAAENGFQFVEGDRFVPKDMEERVCAFKLPTQKQVDQLVDNLRWAPLYHDSDNLVLCQALYRDEHRHQLIEAWQYLGYEVTAVWVKVPFWQNVRQLLKRDQGWRWVAYWLLNKPFFQKPTHPYL